MVYGRMTKALSSPRVFLGRIWNQFRASWVLRDVTLLTLGGAIGHIFAFSVSPILARLYEPADFGMLAMFTGFLGLVAGIACLRYDLAIPAAGDQRSASGLLLISLVATALVSLISAVVLWIGFPIIETGFGLNRAQVFWLLPVAVAAVGSYMAMSAYATRCLWYRELSYTRVIQGVSFAVSGVVFGLLSLGSFGLVIAQTMRHAAGTLRLVRLAFASVTNALAHLEAKELVRLAHRWRRFPTRLVPAGLLNIASLQMPALAIPWLYDLQTAGQFGLVQMTLLAPAGFLTQSLGRVFTGHVAIRLRKAVPLAARLTLWMHMLTVPPAVALAVALIVWAPDVYPGVFGSSWGQAGVFAAIFAPAVAAGLASSPVSQLPTLTGYTDWQLLWDVLRFGILAAGVGYSATADLSVAVFLTFVAVVYALFYLMHLALVWWILYHGVPRGEALHIDGIS